MVLKEAVVLEAYTSNAAKDRTFHEMVGVGAELYCKQSDLENLTGRRNYSYSIDDVMVVPDVDLCNGGIRSRERFSTEPANVILEVVLVAFCPKFFSEWILTSLLWVCN